jgi:bifunctional non-homologous end joining protein LigD
MAQAATLEVTKPDKVLYPAVGFTKADIADYLVRISPVLLPHLRNFPLSLKRYPEGVDGEFFFEKRCPAYHPDCVLTKEVPVKSGTINFCLANNVESLIWLANIACLELHTYLARVNKPETPTMAVFDFDPGAPAGLQECATVALAVHDVLERLGLQSFVKTSGSKGLHMAIPINKANVTFDDTKHFAKSIAMLMERRLPQLVTSIMAKKERVGKVFIDWSQNDRAKTTVCVYSLRAKSHPTVSTPLTWQEVQAAHKAKAAEKLNFETDDVLKRVAKKGDLFEEVLKMKQALPRIGG